MKFIPTLPGMLDSLLDFSSFLTSWWLVSITIPCLVFRAHGPLDRMPVLLPSPFLSVVTTLFQPTNNCLSQLVIHSRPRMALTYHSAICFSSLPSVFCTPDTVLCLLLMFFAFIFLVTWKALFCHCRGSVLSLRAVVHLICSWKLFMVPQLHVPFSSLMTNGCLHLSSVTQSVLWCY